MEIVKKKIRLDEVTLMRCVLALLIVFMHSFTCYQGGWAHPDGFVDIPVYMWIARSSFAFTLEAFVFISGYLMAFQRITLNRRGGLMELVVNKLKRLILPSVLFGILYFFFFFEYKGILSFIYSVINGCGHMWFLPMLFWCFFGGWLLELVNISDGWKMAFLVCLNLFWPFSLPLQMSKAAIYLVYFYGGYMVYKHREYIKSNITIKKIVFSWGLFLIVFVIFRPIKEMIVIDYQSGRLFQILTQSARGICQLIYAFFGTFAFYISAVWYTQHRELKPFTIKLASCCFGIYLFQQFILKGLYYKTSFAASVGPYWLPWLGFVITVPLCFLLTDLLLKTKMGKKLIG